jgi:hypothetical protein
MSIDSSVYIYTRTNSNSNPDSNANDISSPSPILLRPRRQSHSQRSHRQKRPWWFLAKFYKTSTNSKLFVGIVILCVSMYILNYYNLLLMSTYSSSSPSVAQSPHNQQSQPSPVLNPNSEGKLLYNLVVVTMVKDMAPYLPEWIEHHLLLGTLQST